MLTTESFSERKKERTSITFEFITYIISFLKFLFIRIRISILLFFALIIYLSILFRQTEEWLKSRMFWGRSVFYKQAFQFSVVAITFILAFSGFSKNFNIFNRTEQKVLAFEGEILGESDYLIQRGSLESIAGYQENIDFTDSLDKEIYIVKKGDTLASIALHFDISQDTIRWANGLSGDYIKIGQELVILPINGVLHKVKKGDTLASISKLYSASEQDIYDVNWLATTVLTEGQEILVPYGKQPQPKVVPKKLNPAVATKLPVTVEGNGLATGTFMRPCSCGYVSQGYHSRHKAVDIAVIGNSACDIVAADGGVVTMAGWGGNGGNQVTIDHGNGFVTLYAHHAKLYVKVGQKVSKGQPIGLMGRSGHATGVHLHFGINYKGAWLNPYSYVPI